MNGLYKRQNSANWYMRVEHRGVEYRRSTGTPNKIEALQFRDRFLRNIRATHGDPGPLNLEWEHRCKLALEDQRSWLHRFLWYTRRRNKRAFNKTGSLTIERLHRIAVESNGICAVTGIPFRFVGYEPDQGPFAISIDRVLPGKPYDMANCRFVLRAVNYAMHTWGEGPFWQIVNGAVATKLTLESLTLSGTYDPIEDTKISNNAT